MKKLFLIVNFGFLLLFVEAKSITREKRDDRNYRVSSDSYSPYGQGSLSGLFYPETPLAPFPNEDPSNRYNQGIISRGSNSNLESSVHWSPSQSGIKRSQTYSSLNSSPYSSSSSTGYQQYPNYNNNYNNQWNQSQYRSSSGHNSIYPSLNGVQNWNQSYYNPSTNQWQSSRNQWNQTHNNSNRGSYYDSSTHNPYYGNNQWNQTKSGQPWYPHYGTHNNSNYGYNPTWNQNIDNQNPYYSSSLNQWNQTKNINPWVSSGVHSPPNWNQTGNVMYPSQQLTTPHHNQHYERQMTHAASKASTDALKNSPEYLRCISGCLSSKSNYSPVCGTDLKTYANSEGIECAQRCGAEVRFAYNGNC